MQASLSSENILSCTHFLSSVPTLAKFASIYILFEHATNIKNSEFAASFQGTADWAVISSSAHDSDLHVSLFK